MWTETAEDRVLIMELSKEVIAEVAPEELDLFDQLVEEYYDDPTPPDLAAQADDDALGFGLGGVLAASTPAATAMATAVLGLAVQMVVQAFQDESSDFIRGRVKALFNKSDGKEKPGGEEALSFSREQLKKAREIALQEAMKYGIDQDEAGRMADAMLMLMTLGE
jgi:hypothetical protein